MMGVTVANNCGKVISLLRKIGGSKMKFNGFGSVSTGTLRTEDLWNAFMSEADARYPDGENVLVQLSNVAESLSNIDDESTWEAFWESDYANEAVNETLPDLLNNDLPPFVYFGTLEGDGSDFGYWFDHDSFEQSVQDGETLKVAELPDCFPDGQDIYQVAVISDHGNIDLYSRGEGGAFEHLYGVV